MAKNAPVIFSAESWREIAYHGSQEIILYARSPDVLIFEAVPWVWRWGIRPTATYDLTGTDFLLAYYTAAAARFP